MLGREAADVAIAALEELKVRTKAQIPVVSPAYLLLVSLNFWWDKEKNVHYS